MVQELGGMLANWSPNVTVKTVPVQVSVCRVCRALGRVHAVQMRSRLRSNDA